MESREEIKKKITTFLVITFALSTIFYYLIISAGSLRASGGMYVYALMWCPGLAALITQFIFQRNIRELGWKWRKTRYQAIGYALPLLYALAAYLVIWLTGLGGFYNEAFVNRISERLLSNLEIGALSPATVITFHVLVSATLGVLGSCTRALGEEIGWRGLLAPELAKMHSFTKTSLISGAIWSVWHYPLLLFADYNNATPLWYSLVCFTIMVMGVSFALTWLRLKSGSLWTSVFLHASHNVFVQQVFTPLTYNTGNTAYFVDEFGAGLAVVAIVVAYIFWRRRGELVEQ